ncbi:unnamed protein product [Staurois parvus]|uniref:Uncharacterized protein n=1 Tax=Staurois parvus TaxID=386267 RepID=A0ABN9B1V6_9NEOB|nr:unnamed protein product [Staurois parvus]
MAGRWQCRVGWPFINGLPAPCLCALPPNTVKHRSSDGTSVQGPNHVITDWPISDHMQSSKQDVTCDIIAYYM